jgi:hypothetical protein
MPAVAVAAEPAVGKTNFTRDSEVMNAETSAWGRAIVACLAADTQKIASMEEVRNRQSDHPAASTPSPKTREEYIAAAQAKSDAMVAAQPSRAVVGSNARPPQPQEAVVTPIKAGAVTEAQSKLMAKLMRERDVDGVAFCSEQIGRQINSTADLTKSEASKVIQALTNMKGA